MTETPSSRLEEEPETLMVTAIGTAGSFPQLGRGGSTYLVEAASAQEEPFRLLVDCGAPDQIDLHCDPLSLNAIYISHMHPDHMDLAPLIVRHFYHPKGPFFSSLQGSENRIPKIDIYGPQGLEEELARKVNSAHGNPLSDTEGLRSIFRFHVVKEGELSIGPLRATTTRTVHPEETYALRLEHGDASFCYSSDGAVDPRSGLTESVVALGRDADLLICNAPADKPGVHQSPRQAGASAKAAGESLRDFDERSSFDNLGLNTRTGKQQINDYIFAIV